MKQILIFIFSTLFLSSIAVADLYEVTNINATDSLNVRSASRVSSPIISSLPYNAKQIVVLTSIRNRGNRWSKISWNDKEGWVNAYYLRQQTATAFQTFQCSGTEPFWALRITANNTVDYSSADMGNFKAPISLQKVPSGRPLNMGIRVTKAVTANHSAFIVTHEEACNDGMSEINYSYSITALIDGNIVLEGCCN
ncbi:MAG: SH3 domain-containing protein [Cocleimonas sp.]|nr:SH3 domain-containing protein [Cocleimonas sp.]